MKIKYTVLENGLDFVLCSINNLMIATEDTIDEYSKKRLIKYSLLHLSSGIELIFKSRLFKEHWTYVFADMNKAKKELLISGDFHSVDNNTLFSRLENLCSIKVEQHDVKILNNLRKRRNRAEHFDFNEPILSVESLIHKSISILIKFLVENYDVNDFCDEETTLFTEIKDAMRKLTKHYDDAKAIAQKMLNQTGLSEYAVICPECQEVFLLRDDNVKCYFCGYEDTGESAADNYILNIMGIDGYSTVKHGGEYPLYECLQCGKDTFVLDSENERAFCFSCDFDCDVKELKFCSDCGSLFYESDGKGIGICPNCIEYKLGKDD
ncbi:hypothetical protein [Clostridium ganghwense]|uniref:DUF4145 domain-containing protein n=1 Tax=Clostridium ganghwense TaxID=312089 RepID=A0ABT4CTK4_9CLOT|nr:hypothetical protein [Clostridium ganghwense]MCY6372409.1 hypothetical protein [Clostridium ganghwense]